MTKVITLSDGAYHELKKRKRGDDSFSDVVLRLVGGDGETNILDLKGKWVGDDVERVFGIIKKEREKASRAWSS